MWPDASTLAAFLFLAIALLLLVIAPCQGGATTTTRELECHRLRPVMTGFLTHFGPLVMPGLLHGVLGRLIGS